VVRSNLESSVASQPLTSIVAIAASSLPRSRTRIPFSPPSFPRNVVANSLALRPHAPCQPQVHTAPPSPFQYRLHANSQSPNRRASGAGAKSFADTQSAPRMSMYSGKSPRFSERSETYKNPMPRGRARTYAPCQRRNRTAVS